MSMAFNFPAEWLEPSMPDGWDPVSDLSSPIIHIDDNRRVSALVAPYNVCIVDGSNEPAGKCFTAPRSPTRYHYAMTKNHPTTMDPFAWIGWGTNHFSHELGVSEVMDAFANSASAAMAVRYHDMADAGGVFAFGVVHPRLDDVDVDLLRMMALSGHWMRWAANGGRRQYDMLGSQVVLTEAFRREDAVRRYVSRTASAPTADTLTIDLDVEPTAILDLEPRLRERLETHMGISDSASRAAHPSNISATPRAIEFQGQRYSLQPVVEPMSTYSFMTTTSTSTQPAPQFEQFDMGADRVHTAAASTKSKTVTRPHEVIAALDTVTGDRRVFLSAGMIVGEDTVPLTIDHEGTLESIIGSLTNIEVSDDGLVTADVTVDLSTEHADLAVLAFTVGCGYSIEADSGSGAMWSVDYAVQQGVHVGSTPLDELLQVFTQWRIRACSVVVTPAFTEGIPGGEAAAAAETLSADVIELLRASNIEAPIEPLEITHA